MTVYLISTQIIRS